MARQQRDPLRALTDEERECLLLISRSYREPAAPVMRAKALLAVAAAESFTAAATAAGRTSNDAVAQLVSRFNQEGIAALASTHGGGKEPIYAEQERQRILREVERLPDREADSTAGWTLSRLRDALRRAPDGLPEVSTYILWRVLHEAGDSWPRDRSWCQTGEVWRQRKSGVVKVTDPDAEAKKPHRNGIPVGRADGLESLDRR